ncbi:MAG: glycosyltransferase family 39 protein [Gammaproteobacteria bacterium]|nr:glycosyltransferase family 39 protein [Gammaproteobacteria bacterium]
MSPSRAGPFPWRDVLVLSLVGLALIGAGLGLRDPWPADEPRFASLARDMVASGDWLFPHVGGDLYHDKPPLYFWLLAVAYEAFGGFRGWFLLPSLLAGLGTLVLVYDFIRRVAGREAGLLAGLTLVSTLQFLLAMRGAQIDGTLCFLATFSLVALLRHLLLGPAWGWYAAGGFAAGLGVITKGVGFLPILVLLPYVAMRLGGWTGLSRIEGGGARWALAPLALLGAICVWFLPMVLAVAASGTPELAAYRDGILFQQTITRYAQAWHHGEPWHYFFTAVIPGLWLPWSLLLFWLVPRWVDAWPRRDARTWLPLAWVAIVLLFFSFSSGKRGIYVLPALPALAISAAPFLPALFARASIRRASLALAGLLVLAGIAFAGAQLLGAPWAQELLREAPAGLAGPVVAFAALGLAAWLLAALSRPLARLAAGARLSRGGVELWCHATARCRSLVQGVHGAGACCGTTRAHAWPRGLQGTVPALSRSPDGELRSSPVAGGAAGELRRGPLACRGASAPDPARATVAAPSVLCVVRHDEGPGRPGVRGEVVPGRGAAERGMCHPGRCRPGDPLRRATRLKRVSTYG